MSQDRDLVEEERQARLAARADDRTRPSAAGGGGIDAGTRKLAVVAGGLGALLVLMVGGWSLLGHRPAGIPILSPPSGPVRVKPIDPGGMQLMSPQVAQTTDSGAQALAPGPEQAAPQALQAEVDKARLADRPAPVATARAPTMSPLVAPVAPVGVAPPGVAPSGVASAAPAGATPTTAPAGAVATAVPASAADDAAAAVPREAPVAAPPTDPVTAPPAPAPVATQATPAAPATTAGTGHHAVQLAALDSEALARTEWSRLSHRAPGLFAGHTPVIVGISRGGKQFFRLRTGGFGSTAEASAFCARAKQAGIACAVADF